MRLLVLSDLHLESGPFRLPDGLAFDVAVLAGDILAPGSGVAAWARGGGLPAAPLVHVPGNHEYYGSVMGTELGRMRASAALQGVHLLDCDELVLRGVRFLGCTLWTDFSLRPPLPGLQDMPRAAWRRIAMRHAAEAMNEFRLIRCAGTDAADGRPRLLRPEDTTGLHWRARGWLRRKLAQPFPGPTVVVTHHAPHRHSVAPQYRASGLSAGFVSDLPAAYFRGAVLWIHGHTHQSHDYRVGGCRVVCNPRGYVRGAAGPENRAFDPGKVVEI